jgi:hypothetical protein
VSWAQDADDLVRRTTSNSDDRDHHDLGRSTVTTSGDAMTGWTTDTRDAALRKVSSVTTTTAALGAVGAVAVGVLLANGASVSALASSVTSAVSSGLHDAARPGRQDDGQGTAQLTPVVRQGSGGGAVASSGGS